MRRRESPSGESDAELCLLPEDVLERVAQPDATGFLLKRAGLGWYKYWFSLKGSRLLYFEKKTEWRGPLAGSISLFNAKVAVADPNKRPHEFDVVDQSGRTHTLRVPTKLEMQYWLTMFARARKMIPPPQPIIAEKRDDKDAESNTFINNIRTVQVPRHMRVDRVLIIVHGIGTREDSLAKNATKLQQTYRDMMNKVFPDLDYNMEVLVVHWRESVLNLKTHKDIMRLSPSLQGGNALREFILNRVFDALYYTRDRLRNFLWREVVSQLNAHYSEFKKRHPDFEGKVCLFAHSLGGVIMYEILSRQVTDDPMLLVSEGIKLDFEVESLYAIGSPLGGFLTLEFHMGTINLRPNKVPFNVYNIFHPNDPVAMRMEPVVHDRFQYLPPVVLPYWWTMDKTQNSLKWLSTWKQRGEAERRRSQSLAAQNGGSAAGGGGSGSSAGVGGSGRGSSAEKDDPCTTTRSADYLRHSSAGSSLEDPRRYDYALQVVSAIEEVSTAFSAMKAHTEYWTSNDLMLFLLSTMIRESAKDTSKYPHQNRMTLSMFQEIVSGKPNAIREKSIPDAGILGSEGRRIVEETLTIAEAVGTVVDTVLDQVESDVREAIDAEHVAADPRRAKLSTEDGGPEREAGLGWWIKWFSSHRTPTPV